MVRKVRKTTVTRIFDNCPFCGEEIELTFEDEKEACFFCQNRLESLENYEKNKYILGATVIGFDIKDSDSFCSITIQVADGKRYLIEPEGYTEENGIEISRIFEKS